MCINQRNALKSGIACEACQDFLDDVSASSDLGGKLGAKDGDSTVSKHVLTTCQNSKLGQVTCLYSWQSVKAASVRSLVPMHVGFEHILPPQHGDIGNDLPLPERALPEDIACR